MVQWLRLHPSNAGSAGLMPGGGTRIPHAAWHAPPHPPKNIYIYTQAKTTNGIGSEVSSKEGKSGNSLAVQWLGLCASTAGGPGSIPGRGTEIPQATRHSQKQKKESQSFFGVSQGLPPVAPCGRGLLFSCVSSSSTK